MTHGVARQPEADDLDAWQLLLPPTGRFTSLTAAKAYGWWMPEVTERLPVFIAVDATASRVVRSGVRGVRTDPFAEPVKRDGRLLDSAADVLLNAARDVGLLDLIVLVSAALHFGHCTIDEVREAAGRRRRGAPKLRKALGYADGRCQSAYEVLLLVLHQLAGYVVEPQHVVRDAAGDLLFQIDIWLVGTTQGHEYDGADHLEVHQQDKDRSRDRRFVAAGWTRNAYTRKDVVNRFHGILRDCERATDQAPAAGSATRWARMLQESSYTAAGRARLINRCWTQSVTP